MSFCFKREDSSIINSNELTVTIYNINFGHNQELMKRMPEIYEYSYFVDKTRKYEKKGFSRDEVIKRSVSDCIANNIMVKYLEKNYNKVVNMYTMSEDYEDYLIYQGEKKGEKKGVKKGVFQVAKKMLANGFTPSIVSKNTGIPLVEVKKLKEKLL
jgi:predicted transposase/invertase (TIGR01784 family)